MGHGRDETTLEFIEGAEARDLLPLAFVQARVANGQGCFVPQSLKEIEVLLGKCLASAIGHIEQAQRLTPAGKSRDPKSRSRRPWRSRTRAEAGPASAIANWISV